MYQNRGLPGVGLLGYGEETSYRVPVTAKSADSSAFRFQNCHKSIKQQGLRNRRLQLPGCRVLS
jgi:hypothetical protein